MWESWSGEISSGPWPNWDRSTGPIGGIMENAKISKEDVRYVARLARLNVSEEDTETFTLQLNSILSYMDKLNELDTSDVQPMSHAIDVCNAFRQDTVQGSFAQEVALENAPEREGAFFKVPRIVGN